LYDGVKHCRPGSVPPADPNQAGPSSRAKQPPKPKQAANKGSASTKGGGVAKPVTKPIETRASAKLIELKGKSVLPIVDVATADNMARKAGDTAARQAKALGASTSRANYQAQLLGKQKERSPSPPPSASQPTTSEGGGEQPEGMPLPFIMHRAKKKKTAPHKVVPTSGVRPPPHPPPHPPPLSSQPPPLSAPPPPVEPLHSYWTMVLDFALDACYEEPGEEATKIAKDLAKAYDVVVSLMAVTVYPGYEQAHIVSTVKALRKELVENGVPHHVRLRFTEFFQAVDNAWQPKGIYMTRLKVQCRVSPPSSPQPASPDPTSPHSSPQRPPLDYSDLLPVPEFESPAHMRMFADRAAITSPGFREAFAKCSIQQLDKVVEEAVQAGNASTAAIASLSPAVIEPDSLSLERLAVAAEAKVAAANQQPGASKVLKATLTAQAVKARKKAQTAVSRVTALQNANARAAARVQDIAAEIQQVADRNGSPLEAVGVQMVFNQATKDVARVACAAEANRLHEEAMLNETIFADMARESISEAAAEAADEPVYVPYSGPPGFRVGVAQPIVPVLWSNMYGHAKLLKRNVLNFNEPIYKQYVKPMYTPLVPREGGQLGLPRILLTTQYLELQRVHGGSALEVSTCTNTTTCKRVATITITLNMYVH
jgi:hypothetical protein